MNYTYKNAHYEIMNALPNVTAVKLHYPSYAINDAVSQGALGNLRLNIVTTDNMKEIIPVLRRDHLPWEIVMQVTVGRRERTLTVTHIVSHKSEDIIDEFDIRGDEQTRIHFFIHGKGKVTVRDYDLSEVIDDGCVWGVDGRWKILENQLYLVGVGRYNSDVPQGACVDCILDVEDAFGKFCDLYVDEVVDDRICRTTKGL